MIFNDFNKYLSYRHFLQYIDVSHEDKFINMFIIILFHELNTIDQNKQWKMNKKFISKLITIENDIDDDEKLKSIT